MLEKGKEGSEFVQETTEQELVDFYLDLFWQLLEHLFVRFIVDTKSIILIILPSVLKVCLDLTFQSCVERSALIIVA